MSCSPEYPVSIHFVRALSSKLGGPSRSVPGLVKALDQLGFQTCLTTRHADQEFLQREEITNIVNNNINWKLQLKKYSKKLSPKNAVFHCHGIWSLECWWACRYMLSRGYPVIVSPRGMLEPWALQYHVIKKRLAWVIYQKKLLLNVHAFHATSEQEAKNIRALRYAQPIIKIPNGLDSIPDKDISSHGNNTNFRTALFLSRLHPKKGITLLIEAWKTIQPQGWILTIAGNAEAGYLSELKSIVDKHGLHGSIQFLGELWGEEKDLAFANSSIFILPSYSENFGIVVAEALQRGLPVITTTGTPWSELVSEGCGWWVEPTVEGVSTALQEALSLSDNRRREMGRMGANLIRRKYLWPAIAEKMQSAYHWLLSSPNLKA